MSFYDDPIPGFAGHRWQVHKFGGTSVANADCFLQIADIIEYQLDADNDAPSKSLGIVVSAMGGKPKTTDLLLEAVRCASKREYTKVEDQFSIVREKHRQCCSVLFHQSDEQQRLMDIVDGGLNDIRDILKTVSLMKWQSERISGKKAFID